MAIAKGLPEKLERWARLLGHGDLTIVLKHCNTRKMFVQSQISKKLLASYAIKSSGKNASAPVRKPFWSLIIRMTSSRLFFKDFR